MRTAKAVAVCAVRFSREISQSADADWSPSLARACRTCRSRDPSVRRSPGFTTGACRTNQNRTIPVMERAGWLPVVNKATVLQA